MDKDIDTLFKEADLLIADSQLNIRKMWDVVKKMDKDNASLHCGQATKTQLSQMLNAPSPSK